MSAPVSGEYHERAVEAATRAIVVTRNAGREGEDRYAEAAIDAYHRSLAEQGVRLVDLREVVEWLRVPDSWHIADALERRFGGHEGSGPDG